MKSRYKAVVFSDEQDRWMTIAEYLQISRSKLYEMARGDDIPISKVAGQWRFSEAEVGRQPDKKV